MKQKYIFAVIFVVFILAACENEIPFNIKNNPPKLTINALLDCNKEENNIFLHFTGRDSMIRVTEATVKVFVNGVLKEQITESNDLMGYITKIKFGPGDLVKIDIETNDGKYRAWAEDVVPYPIDIKRVDTMTYKGSSSWGAYRDEYLRIKTTFADIPDTKNYYRLAISMHDTVYGSSIMTDNDTMIINEYMTYLVTRGDIVLNGGQLPIGEDNTMVSEVDNRFAIFDDSRLKGDYTMTVSCALQAYGYYWNIMTKQINKSAKVYLMSITESQYYYFRALNLFYSDNYDAYLSQPISFPGNINGGVGIFGLISGTSQVVRLPDYVATEDDWWYGH